MVMKKKKSQKCKIVRIEKVKKKVRRMKVKGLINQMKKGEKRVMGLKVIALKRVVGMKVIALRMMMIVDIRTE